MSPAALLPQAQLLFYYCFEVSSVVPQIFTEPVGIAFHINHISFVCIGKQLNNFDKATIVQLFLVQQSQLQDIDRKLQLLLEQVAVLNNNRFGKSSEKLDTENQICFMEVDGNIVFFNEAEAVASLDEYVDEDETPVLVSKENRTDGNKHYMWVYRTGKMYEDRQIVLYDYQPSRNASHPRDFLKKFKGVCVTDGYQVYHTIEKEREDLKIAGCWAHARRRFDESVKALPKDKKKSSLAYLALKQIQAIYREENKLADESALRPSQK